MAHKNLFLFAQDNLGNLGKEIVLKAGNEALEKGTAVTVPPGGGGGKLPIVSY